MTLRFFLSLLLASSTLAACQNSPLTRRYIPDPAHSVNDAVRRPDSTTTNSSVAECRHSAAFWPADPDLSPRLWIDRCIQVLGLTERDLFASQVASPNYTCSACLEESTEEEGVALACVCNNNTPVFYCNTCLYRNIAQRSTECMNMNSCNKLLPYPIILDASEGGFFNLWLVRVQRGGSSAAEGYVEEALRASDEVVTRYLNQLVALVSNKSDGDFKMATCTHEGCVFQALVEQDHAAPVPCYFHADNRICVQCSHNHNHTTSHQCRTNQIFESAAERREARSMPCPNPACKVETQRTEGCMHMTCTRCDHHWCWYCVWHFFGEPEEEHGDKIRAYATRLEYTQGHMEPLHGGAFFLNGDQYTRYCSTPNCPCKRPYF